MVYLILYLVGLVGFAWCGLKAFDAVRAWRFNRRMAHLRAVADAYEIGRRFAMGSYAQGVTWVIRSTPDRPAPDIKAAIDSITGPQTAAQYPKGS